MRYFLFTSFLIYLSIYSFSCKTVEDDFPTDLGHDYMRLEIGKFIEYEVDSIIYDPTGDSSVFTTKSYLRDVIVDTLLDNIGNVLYRTERYFKLDSLDNWQIQKVYTQSIQGNQGIVTIDNLRFIKLAFPILTANSWNPIVHIDPKTVMIVAGETLEPFLQDGIWKSRILSTDLPQRVGNFNFENVLTIREVNNGNIVPEIINDPNVENRDESLPLLQLRLSYEKYAKGVGLVFRERWILDSQECFETCLPFESNYNSCIDDCLSDCASAGILDNAECTQRCELNCLEEFLNWQDCSANCDTLTWMQKAQKGFIMKQTIIGHN